MDKKQDHAAAETVQTTSIPAVDLPRLVRLCRFCAQKLDLWTEWKSNHCLYDHATSMPCDECDGENLRKPESIFTVRLRLSNDERIHGGAEPPNQNKTLPAVASTVLLAVRGTRKPQQTDKQNGTIPRHRIL